MNWYLAVRAVSLDCWNHSRILAARSWPVDRTPREPSQFTPHQAALASLSRQETHSCRLTGSRGWPEARVSSRVGPSTSSQKLPVEQNQAGTFRAGSQLTPGGGGGTQPCVWAGDPRAALAHGQAGQLSLGWGLEQEARSGEGAEGPGF